MRGGPRLRNMINNLTVPYIVPVLLRSLSPRAFICCTRASLRHSFSEAMAPIHPPPPPPPPPRIPPLRLFLPLLLVAIAGANAAASASSPSNEGVQHPTQAETALDLTGVSPHNLEDGDPGAAAFKETFTPPQQGEPRVMDLNAEALFAALVNHTVRSTRPPCPLSPRLYLGSRCEKHFVPPFLFQLILWAPFLHQEKEEEERVPASPGTNASPSWPILFYFPLSPAVSPPPAPTRNSRAGGGGVHRQVVRFMSRVRAGIRSRRGVVRWSRRQAVRRSSGVCPHRRGQQSCFGQDVRRHQRPVRGHPEAQAMVRRRKEREREGRCMYVCMYVYTAK